MSLSRAVCSLRPVQTRLPRLLVARLASASTPASRVPLGKVEEQGFMKYVRNTSRDPHAKGPKAQLGDTPFTFMTRRIGHAYEVYPLIFLAGFWFVIFCATAYYSFTKIEIWLDRTKSIAPWDWERSRDTYYKQGTVAFDRKGVTRQRCELMEILQDEMLEAAKKRGTR